MARSSKKDPKIKATESLWGNNPFTEYRVVSLLRKNENTVLEIVENDSGKRFIRKSKILKQKGDFKKSDLQKRQVEFLTTARHPALTQVYGYFEGILDSGEIVSTVVRDYVKGESLEELVETKGKPKITTTIDYISKGVEGLNYIHDKGHLHRDFKPSNLIKGRGVDEIVLTDLDSLTKKSSGGLGGSTTIAGTEGWTHPYQNAGLANKSTDLFAVGTTLYYLLTGKQAKMSVTIAGGVTLAEKDLTHLENMLKHQDGGVELHRTISRLVDPNKENQYHDGKELLQDLKQIKQIFRYGYQSSDNDFRVNKESKIKKFGRSVSFITQEIFSKPLYMGLVGGAVLGMLGWGGVKSYLEEKSANRAIYFTPEIPADAHTLVKVSAGISNTTNEVGATYVLLHQDDKPNDIVLQKKIVNARDKAVKIVSDIKTSRSTVGPLQSPVSNIGSGGSQIRSSFFYDSYEYTHEECSESCDEDNNCTTTCWDVCDSIDHYYQFYPDRALAGLKGILLGLERMAKMDPTSIDHRNLIKRNKTGKDELGRPIKNLQKHNQGQNEWLMEGLVQAYNAIVNYQAVQDNQHFVRLKRDSEGGVFFNGNDNLYPLNKITRNNSCGTGDINDKTPQGYIVTKRISQMINNYISNLHQINTTLNTSPAKINELTSELQKIYQELENGKKIKANDLSDAADTATELYKIMVPNSEFSAPSKTARTVWPLVIGIGLFGVAAGAGGFIQYQRPRSYSSYHRRRRRRRMW